MAKKTAKAPAKKQAPTKKTPAAKKAPAVKAKAAPAKAKPSAKGTPATPAAKKAAPAKEGMAAKLLSAAKSLLNGKAVDKDVTAAPKAAAKPEPKAAAKPASTAKPLKLVPTEAVQAAPSEVPASKADGVKPVREGRVLSAVREVREKAPRVTKAAKAEKIAQGEDEAKWVEYHDRYKAEKAPTYDMKATFSAGAPIQHKLLGWGWVLSNENDRLEVLFKDGRRMLISNYNPER